MANGKPPELAIPLASTTATPERGNDCSEDSNTHGGSAGGLGMVTGHTRQVPIDASSSSHESRVTVDFELLWRLRKYLVLLGILAVNVTYNAGLTPPGGFWSKNTKGTDAHYAGDSVLRARFFPRHEVFFYCNATAFAASLILIILLLSKHVARQKLWLRSMQLTMILDLFSLMGAFAAGSCRALKSSIYIWVLVFAVFIYIFIHILVFIRAAPKIISIIKGVTPEWLKKKAQSVVDWVQSKCLNESQESSSRENNLEITKNEDNDLEEARKFILMLVTFAATVTYQAGLSVPGGFWAENKGKEIPGGLWTENKIKEIPATSMLRSKDLARYNTFVICNSTSFVASLVTIILLLSPELSRHGIRSKAVTVCVVVDLLGLIGAYATGSCRSVATSMFVILITVVVWICFAILSGIFVHKPVADWLVRIKPDIKWYMDKIGRVFSLESHRNRSRNREGDNSVASSQQIAGRETDSTKLEGACEPEYQLENHQLDAKHHTSGKQQTENTEEVVSGSEEHALINDVQSENTIDAMRKREDQATDCKSAVKVPMSETENQLIAYTREQSSSMDDLKTTIPAAKEPISTTENLPHANTREQSSPYDLRATNPVAKDPISRTENLLHVNTREQSSSMDDLETTDPMDGMPNSEYQSADSEQVAKITGQSSSNNGHKPSITPVVNLSKDTMVANDFNAATNDPSVGKESPDVPRKAIKTEIVEINGDARNPMNGNISKNEGPYKQNDNNTFDEHLKKSRTYLLLLAILAVSLTYQSGLNPPGGFWSKREDNNSTGDPNLKYNHHRRYHLPGNPILEDTHHQRYIAFFYLNAIAFVASLVMIIILLSRRMSNKVIKRYALQVAMIVDLLALTGSYIMGSCRETKNSIYISLLVFLVLAYVAVHVLIAIHVIPEGCKNAVAVKLDKFSCRYIWKNQPSFGYNQRGDANDRDCELGHNQRDDPNEKDWERRRNLLLMLAVLAATVTYQAGMNPPGGVWSDDPEVGGNPGDPILQHNHNNLKRYDVFYYSNSISFVSSVVITILLVNKESCEHGIKFYALRVCLVVGLVGLLIAYSAGSCRKATQSIYHIIIAVAVLISLVIQVLLLSSTEGTPQGPTRKIIECLLQLLSYKEATQETTSKQKESQGRPKEKRDKRHKYLMLLAILAASITYQAGLNPPGGIWSDDEGHVAGNPILLDIHPGRYKIFFWCNSISLMASIVVIMFLLNRSVRKKDVPLWVLHIIMVFDLLALMTAFAAGSCRKFRTSVYVYALVLGVVIYLVIVIFVSSGIAKCLRSRERSGHSSQRNHSCALGTNTPKPGEQA